MKTLAAILVVLGGAMYSPSASAQIISTVCGTGAPGYNMDNIAATGADINGPFGIAISSGGDLYIADRLNNRVRKVNSAGIISTIAGTGVSGFSGDDGPATMAQLADPVDVAVDNDGYVYIADKGNSRIRRVGPTGLIMTIAGTTTAGYNWDNGPAALTELNSPRGVAVDGHGNIYISDQGNNLVRKINPSLIISTVAGTRTAGYNGDGIDAKTAQLNGPYGIAADGLGNVYVSDVDNERIRKIDASGIITTIAGTGFPGFTGDGGPAVAAQLFEPIDVAVDGAGNVYIADGWNNRVRAINSQGAIYTIAGNGTQGYGGDGGPALAAELDAPYGVAPDGSGNIYIADYGNNRVRYMTRPTHVKNVIDPSFRVNIYPNPSCGTLTVNINSILNEPVQITLTTLLGEKLVDISGAANRENTLHFDAPPGVYFLHVSTLRVRGTAKLL